MKSVKFTPPPKVIGARLRYCAKKALAQYKKRLVECGQDHDPFEYDFNRAFEYGVQWALDNLDDLAEYRKYSHYGYHHPLNYEKYFDPKSDNKNA